jgi:hypothetical protein
VSAFILGKEVHNRRLLSYSLLLPAALCLGVGGSFLFGWRSSGKLNDALQTLKTSLRRTLAPHARNLTTALAFSECFYLVLALFSFSFVAT